MEPIILEPQPSWWSRNWKWFVPLVSVGPLMLSIGCCGGILGIVFYGMRSSWAFANGVELARHDPEVIAELGEPIESGWFASGSINVNTVSGYANLAVPLRGPRQSGTLFVIAQKVGNQWSFVHARVETANSGKTIDLLKPRN